MIGILFRGKVERHPDTGWEPFTNNIPEPEPEFDPKLAQEWKQIIGLAKQKGIIVRVTEEGIKMVEGKSHGTFTDARGGLDMAKEFIRECLKNR